MRAFFVVALTIAAFGAIAAATEAELPEFVACSFHGEFHTRVLNEQREVVSTSKDHLYFDGGQYWRWDSDFSGVEGVMEPHQWIIIWRPDLEATYHDYGTICKKNDDRAQPPPPPYQWLLRNTNGISWFRIPGTWEGMDVYIYHSTFTVNKYSALVTSDFYFLKEDDSLVLVNGTVKSESLFLDLTYHMDAISYEHNVPFPTTTFLPAAHCSPEPLSAPAEPSADFKKKCYASAATPVVASWFALLLLVVASLLV